MNTKIRGPVVINGATSGVAQALIQQLNHAHVPVIALGRSLDALSELYGGHAGITCAVVDALDGASVQTALAQAAERAGLPTGYVHCIGSIALAPLHRTTDEMWSQTLQVNLTTAMVGLRAFIQQVRGKHPASVVLMSTCAANTGVANHEAVAAAKGGLEAMMRSAAASYASDHIRVNCVSPGLTNTAMAQPLLKSEVLAAAASKQYPLGGINQAEEVADCIAWLLSEQSRRVTGQNIAVDGGFSHIRPLVK